MKETTEKSALREYLEAADGHFRLGEDTAGFDSLTEFLNELECTVEGGVKSGSPQIELNRLLPVLRNLNSLLRNQDIAGMTDLLEDTLIPLTENRQEGRGEP